MSTPATETPLRLQKLIKTVNDFIKVADAMLENGEITQVEYTAMTKKKKDFLQIQERANKIIPFVKPQ